MILDEDAHAGNGTTLDTLFRRAGVRHHERLALVDPPDRDRMADGAPRALTFGETDRAISALAGRLRDSKLQTDAIVAIQLGNAVESVISLLAVLRAGMIAAPLPLLWRERDIVAALGCIGAKAIITASRIGAERHAEIAMRAAAELFCIRHVYAFGTDVPDGVAPLDDVFVSGQEPFVHPPARLGNASAHVALVTFDTTAQGLLPVARHHGALVAGGRAIMQEAALGPEAAILSAIVPGSFAALALSVVPWLLSGGTLHLHHPFDGETFARQCPGMEGGMIVVPGPALATMSGIRAFDDNGPTIAALWRAPERIGSAAPWQRKAPLLDIAGFGELAVIGRRRSIDGLPAPLPDGAVMASSFPDADAPVAIETRRSAGGTLLLRGAMLPATNFLIGAEPHGPQPFAADGEGFIDSGFACRQDPERTALVITAPPAGIGSVGGYRFRRQAVEDSIAMIDPTATIAALPDAALGQRFAGSARNADEMASGLAAHGINPLIARAFRSRQATERN
jgi:hypothetical protein